MFTVGCACVLRWCWLGGGAEGDVVAEGFELANVVAFLGVWVDVFVVVVGAQIVEARRRSSESRCQTITRMERPTATIGRLLAAAFGDPPVTLPEERVGPAGHDRRLAEDPGEVAVAVASGSVALGLAGRGADAGENFAHEHRCPAVGNRDMSTPTSLPDRFGRHETRAQHLPFGDLAQPDGVQRIGLGSTRQMFGDASSPRSELAASVTSAAALAVEGAVEITSGLLKQWSARPPVFMTSPSSTL